LGEVIQRATQGQQTSLDLRHQQIVIFSDQFGPATSQSRQHRVDRFELVLENPAQQQRLDALDACHYCPDLRQREQLDDDVHDPLCEVVHGRFQLIVQRRRIS